MIGCSVSPEEISVYYLSKCALIIKQGRNFPEVVVLLWDLITLTTHIHSSKSWGHWLYEDRQELIRKRGDRTLGSFSRH